MTEKTAPPLGGPGGPPQNSQIQRWRTYIASRPGIHLLFFLLILFGIQYIEGIANLAKSRFSRFGPSLDQNFMDHCHSLLVPPEGYYTSRLSRLSSALSIPHSPPGVHESKAKGATWIAEPGPSAQYVLGAFSSRDWWLSERPFLVAVTPDLQRNDTVITLLTPEFEALRAGGIPIPDEVKQHVRWLSWREDENPYEVLARSLKGLTDVVLMDDMVRSFVVAGVRDAMRDIKESSPLVVEEGEVGGVEASGGEEDEPGVSPMTRLQEAVWALRERKDEREIGLLRCANQLTLHALRRTRSRMHIGITESKTSAILEEEMAKTGLIAGEGLVLFGGDAALPHGTGTDRALGEENLILIDVGGKWGGYVSDITRTFALPSSKIPRLHRDVWETVRKAQYAPYQFLKTHNSTNLPKLNKLDRAARRVVTDYMLPGTSGGHPNDHQSASADFSFFTHRLGHGIGLEGHERPYLVPGPVGEQKIAPGNVFSLEPGIYVPWQEEGRGRTGVASKLNGVGVRLEDCFVVTVDDKGQLGGEWLTGPVEKWGDV